MKQLSLLIALFISFSATAQTSRINNNALLPIFPLDISWHKTTLLIFPEPIRRADRGDSYVLAETFKDADNMLKVKAGKRDFEESNLQVVTAGGKVYSFTVSYKDNIAANPIDMGKVSTYAPVTFKGLSLNSEEIKSLAKKVGGNNAFLSGGKFRHFGIKLWTQGIYIKNDVLFFQFHLKNTTQLPYEAASIRFFVRDRKKARRTASQDKEMEPLLITQDGSPESEKGLTIIAAFPRFTIAESKYLAVEIMERDGDRNPTNRIKQKKLIKARSL